ncbi:bifunctional DNA primase/polymerase [Lichenicoccus roseus]|uniref:Bifunctional DNA primase/polymerase n=1 Tax=Lichenicoccus roseus TaxID=2683649 RepID=A0A5R9J3N4_9PROT|nr:bifunctional DNA primase/polymerase [Lichenicoccus roseus]
MRAALELAALGYRVFPCLLNKAPACPRGFKDAVADPDAASQLFRQYPSELIGVATGSGSGIDVLDLDPDNGSDAWLEQHRHRLPATRTHRTRSGGLHLLFLHREGVRNTAGRIASGVDTRGQGGYIVWWPAAGLAVSHPEDLAQWPGWLLETLLPKPVVRPVPVETVVSGAGYAAAALQRAEALVKNAPEGTRHDQLNYQTWSLARFIPKGELSAGEIISVMTSAARHAGLDDKEIIRTVAQAVEAGQVRT